MYKILKKSEGAIKQRFFQQQNSRRLQ